MSQDRYLRHSLIDWFDQNAVREASVLVAGAGATGNEALKNLALLGLGQIHIVDFDRVEAHNLTKSVLFKEADIGLYKADVAAKAISAISPDTRSTASVMDIWQSLTLKELRNFDAVFCCVDNYEARLKLNRLCLLGAVDLYNSGIDSRFVSVEKFPFRSQPGRACYDCGLPQSAYTHMKERYSCGWLRRRAYEERKIPTTTVTSSIAGAMMCSLFLQRRHGHSPDGAVRFYFDTITGNTSVVSLLPRQDCSSCQTLGLAARKHRTTRESLVGMCMSLGLSDEDTLWLSDRLVLGMQCSKCGKSLVINDLADKYDDGLTFCGNCHLNSNNVDIRDSLTLTELSNLFRERRLPVKYVWFAVAREQIVIELED